MRFSEGKKRISQRVAMAIVVLAVLAAFACLTGCSSSGRSTKAIAVADTGNNRVLIYKYPITTYGQPANLVLGQPGFITNGAVASAIGMTAPGDVAQDNAGNLYVADTGNNRILQFVPPFTDGMAASVAIGQPSGATNLTTNGFSDTNTGLERPIGLAFDHSGNLWVVDNLNNRIVEYVPPFTAGMAASVVIGQTGFGLNAPGTSQTTLREPAWIAFDGSGNLWVTDQDNNRVLEYSQASLATNAAAAVVIGQAGYGNGTVLGTNPANNTLIVPCGIAFDHAGNLWVGDAGNSRVLEFMPPFTPNLTNSITASVALGQIDLNHNNAVSPSQSGFSNPLGLDFDSRGNLAVADEANSRTMAFKPPFTTDQLAEGVLGQPDFVTNGAVPPTAASQAFPFSVRALY